MSEVENAPARRWLPHLVRRLWCWLLDCRNRCRDRRALGAMSDHLLRDLGFGPDQVYRLRRRCDDDRRLNRWRWRGQDM